MLDLYIEHSMEI